VAAKPELDDFTLAYLEAALWSSTDESDEAGGEPLDKNFDIEDFAPEAIKEVVADTKAFQEENAGDLAKAAKFHSRGEWSSDEQHGHDFWLTRNRHGAGFWDRGYGPVGKRLTDAAHAYGEVHIYVGDDGKLYVE
jgi:hypothetical protein